MKSLTIKPWLLTGLLALFVFSMFLFPATYVVNKNTFIGSFPNFITVLVQQEWSYGLLVLLFVLSALPKLNAKLASGLSVALLVSYLWVVVPDGLSMLDAAYRVYGYYITAILGFIFCLTWLLYRVQKLKK